MNETPLEKKFAVFDKGAFLADIERLYLQGLTTREMAEKLGSDALVVSRNLRELKKRWSRAAARQEHALSQTQCATVFREAMQGWQRSLDPKTTTTEENKTGDKNGESARSVTRREQGPGDKAFLQAAVAALKALRRFAAEQPDKPRPGLDPYLVELLHEMTPEQVEPLSHEQLTRFRRAVDARRKELAQRRREADSRRSQQEDRGRPSWPSQSTPSRTTARTGTTRGWRRCWTGWRRKECRRLMVFLPPQARQERTGEPPLSGVMLGSNPELRLIAASHTHELAVAMNRDVQRIMDHQRYRDLFPEVRLATPRSPRGLFLPRRTMGFFEIAGRRGSLRSAGVGQSIAGLPADGAIIDDPFGKREDADARRSARRFGTGTSTTFTRGFRPRRGSCSRTPAGTATTWRAGF